MTRITHLPSIIDKTVASTYYGNSSEHDNILITFTDDTFIIISSRAYGDNDTELRIDRDDITTKSVEEQI